MPDQRIATHKTKSQRKRSRGFALVGLIAILPVALSFLSIVAAAAMVLKHDTQISALCDRETFQLQEAMAKKLDELLKLNPRAKKLIEQKKDLQKCAETDPEPNTKAGCEAALAIVVVQQIILAAQQHIIIGTANTSAQISALKLQNEIKNEHPRVIEHDLQVWPKQLIEIAPEYNPVSHFSEAQRIEVHYSTSLAAIVDSTLLKILGVHSIHKSNLSRACAATIVKSGNKYKAQLAEAKK
jgi:hypothetical protein